MRSGHPDHLNNPLEPFATATDPLCIPIENTKTDARPEFVRRAQIHPHESPRIINQGDLAVGFLKTVRISFLEIAIQPTDGRTMQGGLPDHHLVLLFEHLLQFGDLISLLGRLFPESINLEFFFRQDLFPFSKSRHQRFFGTQSRFLLGLQDRLPHTFHRSIIGQSCRFGIDQSIAFDQQVVSLTSQPGQSFPG